MTRIRSTGNQRGVTLIELLIALSLVAALSTGLLMAMRTSLITLEKTESRLDDNRRVMGMEQMLRREIGGVMPVHGNCPGFAGAAGWLRLVTSYSMTEGARGFPRILELTVLPDPQGGLRLVANELPYSSPASLAPFCQEGRIVPAQAGAQPLVLAARLALCRIDYRAPDPEKWVAAWNRPDLPAAVHIDMAPVAVDVSRLPVISLHVPIHVTREVFAYYEDQQ